MFGPGGVLSGGTSVNVALGASFDKIGAAFANFSFGEGAGLVFQGLGYATIAGGGAYFTANALNGWFSRNEYLPITPEQKVDLAIAEATRVGGGNYFEDVRVYTLNFGNFKKGAAMTIPGIGIFVGPGGAKDVDLLRHEYGHILQYNKWGAKVFWGEIVPASLRSARKANSDWSFNHMDTWSEWSANRLSYQYFNQPSDWKFNKYPVWPSTTRPGVMPPFVVGPFDLKFNWFGN